MPAKAVHQSSRRVASTSMAGANNSGATADRVHVPCLPEEQVDGIEGRIAKRRTRVDGDQAALFSCIEDVDWSEVAMEEDGRRWFRGKPEGQALSPVEQLLRDQRHLGRVTLALSCPG